MPYVSASSTAGLLWHRNTTNLQYKVEVYSSSTQDLPEDKSVHISFRLWISCLCTTLCQDRVLYACTYVHTRIRSTGTWELSTRETALLFFQVCRAGSLTAVSPVVKHFEKLWGQTDAWTNCSPLVGELNVTSSSLRFFVVPVYDMLSVLFIRMYIHTITQRQYFGGW